MADLPPTPAPAGPLTADTALGHAARLLLNAELITDQALMQRYESLADSWIAIARTLDVRQEGP
ncbi:hypothetical protein [Streptomyces aureus]|uniref:hypothetical protein n=1 Tax=Streptomyces aureus TaxID=193461 RepID=UPI0005658965|nr:hypothetical protein [Streptomyces aureus]